MKNIIEILKSQNIELNEEQSKTIQEEVNANYKTIADYNKQKDKLDLANTQLKETKDAFDEFKKGYEGVDIDELKGKVDTLTQQLADKDTDYQNKLGSLELKGKLKDALREKGCIDIDLAMTQFNIDELLTSKNQDKDLETSISNLVENKKMLFQQEEPKPKGGINLGGGTGGNDSKTHDNLLRQAMGLEVKGD